MLSRTEIRMLYMENFLSTPWDGRGRRTLPEAVFSRILFGRVRAPALWSPRKLRFAPANAFEQPGQGFKLSTAS